MLVFNRPIRASPWLNLELEQSLDAASGFELLPSPLDQRFRNIPEFASVFVGELFYFPT
jgi:hypothetical protein